MLKKNNEKSAAGKKKNSWKENNKKSDNSRSNHNINELKKDFHANSVQKYLNFWNPDIVNKHKKTGYIYGIPGFKGDAKFRVKFIKPDKKLYENFKINDKDKCEFLPVAKLKRLDGISSDFLNEFIAINLKERQNPVVLYDPDNKKTKKIADSFDNFLEMVTAKNEKLPSERIEEGLKNAMHLYYKGNLDGSWYYFKEIDVVDIKDRSFSGNENLIAISYKYIGLIYNKNGNIKKAMKYLSNALDIGMKTDFYDPFFRIIEIHENEGDFKEVAEEIKKFREKTEDKEIDDEALFFLCLHSGLSNLRLSEAKKAGKEFDSIIRQFSKTDVGKIYRAINSVYELVKSGCNKALAGKILSELNDSIDQDSI